MKWKKMRRWWALRTRLVTNLILSNTRLTSNLNRKASLPTIVLRKYKNESLMLFSKNVMWCARSLTSWHPLCYGIDRRQRFASHIRRLGRRIRWHPSKGPRTYPGLGITHSCAWAHWTDSWRSSTSWSLWYLLHVASTVKVTESAKFVISQQVCSNRFLHKYPIFLSLLDKLEFMLRCKIFAFSTAGTTNCGQVRARRSDCLVAIKVGWITWPRGRARRETPGWDFMLF